MTDHRRPKPPAPVHENGTTGDAGGFLALSQGNLQSLNGS
jgi:hypothetical protein